MMDHFSEDTLNEYLDGALEGGLRRQVEAHLTGCGACQARLTALDRVGAALAGLPEQPPVHDLAPAIMKRLVRRPSIGRLALAFQTGFVIALALMSAPWLAGRLNLGLDRLASRAAVLPVVALPRFAPIAPSLPAFRIPSLPTVRLPVEITPGNAGIWLALGIAAGLLFLVGNLSLVLLDRSKKRK